MYNIKVYILLEFNYRPIREGNSKSNKMINNEKLGEQ